MPALISDEMLDAFCVTADEARLPDALKQRYAGIADRLALYTPFAPGQRDEFWRRLVGEF